MKLPQSIRPHIHLGVVEQQQHKVVPRDDEVQVTGSGVRGLGGEGHLLPLIQMLVAIFIVTLCTSRNGESLGFWNN